MYSVESIQDPMRWKWTITRNLELLNTLENLPRSSHADFCSLFPVWDFDGANEEVDAFRSIRWIVIWLSLSLFQCIHTSLSIDTGSRDDGIEWALPSHLFTSRSSFHYESSSTQRFHSFHRHFYCRSSGRVSSGPPFTLSLLLFLAHFQRFFAWGEEKRVLKTFPIRFQRSMGRSASMVGGRGFQPGRRFVRSVDIDEVRSLSWTENSSSSEIPTL